MIWKIFEVQAIRLDWYLYVRLMQITKCQISLNTYVKFWFLNSAIVGVSTFIFFQLIKKKLLMKKIAAIAKAFSRVSRTNSGVSYFCCNTDKCWNVCSKRAINVLVRKFKCCVTVAYVSNLNIQKYTMIKMVQPFLAKGSWNS